MDGELGGDLGGRRPRPPPRPARRRRARRRRRRSSARGRRTCPARSPRAGRGRRLGDLGSGDRERRLERAGGEVGQLGRGVVDAEVVGQVAGGEPGEQPPVLDAERVDRLAVQPGSPSGASFAGSAPTAFSSAARTAYAAGRVEPRNGSASSRHCSGCRQRWSVSAWLAPSTDSSRIAVPSSSASSAISPGSARSARRTRPGQGLVGVGGAGQQSDQRLGVVPEPGELVVRAGRVVEAQPQQPGARGVAAGAHRVNLRPRLRARGLRRVLDLVQAIRKLSCLM